MHVIGKKAIKMGCIQVLPGLEFSVVKALKEACKSNGGTPHVIFKGLGFYDIFIFYQSQGFESHLTPAGTIPGIINSNTYLCFPYLGCDANDFFKKLEQTTFAGLSLLKLTPYSEKRIYEIEELLKSYLNDKIENHWSALGTLGWNEVVLLISFEDIQKIVKTLLDLNYRFANEESRSDFIYKTFSYVGINHDMLPVLEKENADIGEMRAYLEQSDTLKAQIPDSIIPSINISSQPQYYGEIKKYWNVAEFSPHDSLGNFDIVVERQSDELGNLVQLSWAQFLSFLLCFRLAFQTRINSTYTTIATIDSNGNGTKMDNKEERKTEGVGTTSVPIKEYNQKIYINYNDFKEVFRANTDSLVNHFYTLNSVLQNPVSGHAFIDMSEYHKHLLRLGKQCIEDEIRVSTIDKLYLQATNVIRRGTSLRSYGIAGNQERVHGHFSEIRGGAQRALLAMEYIPDYVFGRLNSSWYAFINVDDPKFAHFNQVIICPTKALWEPEQWWALYHEIGHIILEQVPWTEKSDPIISSFLKNMPSPKVWHHFIIELYAEVLGFILGFFSNFDLYLEVLWNHLISIETSQKEFTPLWPYLIRSYFVKLYEQCFRKCVITENEFQDEIWLYRGLLEHIDDVLKVTDHQKQWPKSEKLFFAANHCQTLKELYPLAKHLHDKINSEEHKKSISFAPHDLTKSTEVDNAMDSIMEGKIYFGDVSSPESLLYNIVLDRKKLDFHNKIAAVLTYWNLSHEKLKEY